MHLSQVKSDMLEAAKVNFEEILSNIELPTSIISQSTACITMFTPYGISAVNEKPGFRSKVFLGYEVRATKTSKSPFILDLMYDYKQGIKALGYSVNIDSEGIGCRYILSCTRKDTHLDVVVIETPKEYRIQVVTSVKLEKALPVQLYRLLAEARVSQLTDFPQELVTVTYNATLYLNEDNEIDSVSFIREYPERVEDSFKTIYLKNLYPTVDIEDGDTNLHFQFEKDTVKTQLYLKDNPEPKSGDGASKWVILSDFNMQGVDLEKYKRDFYSELLYATNATLSLVGGRYGMHPSFDRLKDLLQIGYSCDYLEDEAVDTILCNPGQYTKAIRYTRKFSIKGPELVVYTTQDFNEVAVSSNADNIKDMASSFPYMPAQKQEGGNSEQEVLTFL